MLFRAGSDIGPQKSDGIPPTTVKPMTLQSVPTRGRTLDHAARVYDALEPILLLGKQAAYDRHLLTLLAPRAADRILDLGCGTGVLTRLIGDRLDPAAGGRAWASTRRPA